MRRFFRYLQQRVGRLRGPYIVLDVGASNGKQFLRRCREDRNTIVYAFEPEPESFRAILENTQGLSNFHAFQMAVSDTNGERTFNVATVIGNHSFYEFVDDVNKIWKDPYIDQISWVPNFHKKKQIVVKTTRLDTFITQMRLPHVSFLHIDAQGEDLNILKSLGDKTNIVRAGVIEVCLEPLYKDQFTKMDAVACLKDLGFEVDYVTSEHFGLVENLYFKRRSNIV